MRVIKMLGAVLLGCAALMSIGASAQQVVSVSCSWSVVSSYGPPDNSWRDIVRECREANGTLVATQSFRGYNATGVTQNCVLSPAANISYTGACMTPSFTRTLVASSSAQSSSSASSCNSGAYIGSGCANSMTASPGFGAAVQQVCGTGCPVRYENFGATNGCWTQSPYLKAYCK